MLRRAVVTVVTSVTLLAGPDLGNAIAQDDPGIEFEDPVIIPEPNSGVAPEEAGDRGGALQLGILGGLVVAVGGAIGHLVRQSRRVRSTD